MKFVLASLAVVLVGCFASPAKKIETIVGENKTDIRQVPYQVSIQFKKPNKFNQQHFCGGAIIGTRFILTAVNCRLRKVGGPSVPLEEIQVRTGSSKSREGGQVHEIKRWIELGVVERNNIALIELAEPMVFNENQRAIDLATSEPQDNETALVSGWGVTDPLVDDPIEDLRSVRIPIVDKGVCSKYYKYPLPGPICAGPDGKDPCVGDLGGPLVVNEKLVGILSDGPGCHVNVPSIYSTVSYYRDWILWAYLDIEDEIVHSENN